jgi:hypothetical protein
MPKILDGNYFVFVVRGERGDYYEGGSDTPERAALLDSARQGAYVYDSGNVQTLTDGVVTEQPVELFVANGPEVVKTIGDCHLAVVERLGATCFSSREVIFPSAW